jgi:hypothetical protein
MSDLPIFTAAEIAAHGTKDDLWVTIQGKGNCRRYIEIHVHMLKQISLQCYRVREGPPWWCGSSR